MLSFILKYDLNMNILIVTIMKSAIGDSLKGLEVVSVRILLITFKDC